MRHELSSRAELQWFASCNEWLLLNKDEHCCKYLTPAGNTVTVWFNDDPVQRLTDIKVNQV